MKKKKIRLSRREQIVSLEKMEKLKKGSLLQNFRHKRIIESRPIVCR